MNKELDERKKSAWRHDTNEQLEKAGKDAAATPETTELAGMVHELMVHQVELEMQNEELLEARSELEANAELLAELYDYAPVGYFSISANGLIRQLNIMGARMLGRERIVLLGRGLMEFIVPENRRIFERFLARVFTGEKPEPCELKFNRHRQDPVIASLTGNLSPSGLVCRMAAMDVTEKRRMQSAVRQKNDDLDRIFNLSHDMMGIAGGDGRFRRVNPAFQRVLGYSPDELASFDYLHFVHPDDREATMLAMARLKAGEELLDLVNRYRCADGSYRWLEWRASPYGDGLVCAMARDVTERKQAEDALRVSEEKFRSIFESSPTAMYLYHLGEDDRLILMEANPAADKELGIEHRPLIGQSAEEAFPNLLSTGVPEKFREVAMGTLGAQSFEVCYDDDRISGYFEVRVFQTHPGTIVVAFADVSDRRLVRENYEKTQQELESRVRRRTEQLQDRTVQLRALADELSHAEERERRRIAGLIHEDLQQMLVAALLNLGMLKSRIGSDAAEDLNHVECILKDSVRTARSLTAELSPPVLQQCGLAAALKWLRTWCGEKYAMDLNVDVEEGADPGQEVSVTLFHCVRELLFNIVKHAGVRTAGLRMWRGQDGVVKIEVSDQGVGFDPKEVRAREGSAGGFGLFSIRERLELLGGGFDIESSPRCGSCFTLQVPLEFAGRTHGEPEEFQSAACGMRG